MMRPVVVTLILASVAGPAWAIAPQTALPRPIACGSGITRVAATERPGANCPQWLSTAGVMSKRSTHRG